MGYLCKTGITIICAAFIAACQPMNNDQAAVSNGMVLTGDMGGQAFSIATGNEDELFMDMVEAFNNMDVEALWINSADTISFHGVDGSVGPLTKADMAGFFSTVDSLKWEIDAVIPVKVTGSNRVSILADGKERAYMKDGTVTNRKLFERFIFENGKLIGVRQWEAAMPADNSSQ